MKRRTRTLHADVSARLRETPGQWQLIKIFPASYVATSTAASIQRGTPTYYSPAGSYEARTEPTEMGTALYARYVGPTLAGAPQ